MGKLFNEWPALHKLDLTSQPLRWDSSWENAQTSVTGSLLYNFEPEWPVEGGRSSYETLGIH